ncbi:hypothetical protein [Staphylococcus epidermidis]|uniref:hypothetical protein n=1 Tax=Staphylococcus epidermidis TaxID=1282 RepID=UPI002DBE424D|nr:hypothetical protein [Staphylococcus epidermidis]MEB7398496.1 hypothetical protein [Staphylococcus epidermidis]
MANGIDKKALFKFKSEPYLRPISDLGVGFYNLDENTAILRFQLSNEKGPLLIHENNLTAYAYFESSNGSVSDVIELDIEDSFNGIVTITLDKEFLQASTSTSVTGQVYIAVNNVDRKEKYNEVAVFREFTFTVKDALINKISSFTKVEYIRMFDKLKMHIEQRIKDIEEAIANGEDYVAEMKLTLKNGIEEINNTVTEAVETVNKISEDASNKINETKDEAITTVNNSRDEVLNAINDNEVVRKTEMSGYFDEQDWQKYKLTNDDGTTIYKREGVDFNNPDDLNSLPLGTRYIINATNLPDSVVSGAGWLTKQVREDNSVAFITFKHYNSNKVYQKVFYKTWGEWERVNLVKGDMDDWQKYKLTEDNGKSLTADLNNDLKKLIELSPGMYYLTNVPALPTGVNSEGNAISVHKNENSFTTKRQVLFMPFNASDIYICNNASNFTGWQKVGPTQGDTGWIPFQLVNGAKSNTEYGDDLGNGFKCSYRTVISGDLVTNYLRINGRSISPGAVIGRLPAKMVKNAQTFIPRTPTDKPIGYIILYTNGDIKFFANRGTGTNSWDSSAYIYGEFSWIN